MLKIIFCKKCGTLDYAKGKCPKCGNTEIDKADLEFLTFGSSTVQSLPMPVLWINSRSIEKFGWNG